MIVKEYKEINGIKVFNKNIDKNYEDYNEMGLDTLYSQEEKHFWFLSRKNFILQNFKKYIPFDAKIIEIGAGTGNVSRHLQKGGFNKISVGEIHLKGLEYAKTYGIEDCYQFDLLDNPFREEFNVVCLFDVLEHIEDDELALNNINKMLTKEGKLILSVPSHMWLWNRDDAIAGHKIRYTKKQLVDRIQAQGFKVINAKYFFIFITPLLFLRRLVNKDNGSKVRNSEYSKGIKINPFISKVLEVVSNIENKLNRFLPNCFGGSLLIVAQKTDSD